MGPEGSDTLNPSTQAPVNQAGFELAKWVAILTMAIDHYGKIVAPDLFLETHAIGRVAFPLFAAIIGLRLADRPSRAAAYLKRLLPWAVVSQPVFVLVGRDWLDGNIMITLAIGVTVVFLLERFRQSPSPVWVLGLLALLPIAWFCEFGILGAAMIPAMALIGARHVKAGLWATGPLGLVANIVPAWPPLTWVDLAALASSLIMILSVNLNLRLPRLPSQAFYAFYPAHLLALHFYDLYV